MPPPQRRAGHVGVGDFGVVKGSGGLVTYGLGSCVAICVFIPHAAVAGMLHFMLPDSRQSGAAADPKRPGVFADTGFAGLLREMRSQRIPVDQLRAKLVGGANVSNAVQMEIGARNVLAARRLLWQHRLPLEGEEVGGSIARTVRLRADGLVIVSSPGTEERRI